MELATATEPADKQFEYWNTAYAGSKYFYGSEPGPVARRAVRYHRPLLPAGGTAIDFGCGEGQDLAFLAEQNYAATGLELTSHGATKARQLLSERDLTAEVRQIDLRSYQVEQQFDLVLAINSIQFLGRDGDEILNRVIESVARGGVLGLSLFARETSASPIENDIFRVTLDELTDRLQSTSSAWQMLEAANVWQWNRSIDRPQAFVTLIAQRVR